MTKNKTKKKLSRYSACWLCGKGNTNTTITVECETPGGKDCKPKEVRVHYGCYMDMEP